MKRLIGVYRAKFRAEIASQFAYRGALVIWLLGLVIEPIVSLVVWTTVAETQGGSVGGFTAATFAALHPETIAALVLLAPAFELGPRWRQRMGAAEVERWRAQGTYAFDHYAYGRKEDLGYAFLEDAERHPGFPLPRCRTLVLQGTRDEVVEPALAREFVRRMAGRAELVELPEGHELTGDLPGLWKRIDRFLASYGRPTP